MLRRNGSELAGNNGRDRIEESRGHRQADSGEPFTAVRAGQLAGEQDHHAAEGEEQPAPFRKADAFT